MWLVVIYCILIVLASMLGGWLPSLVRLTHTRMQVTMSLVAGLMLGVALLHLLPEAVHLLADSAQWAFGGALVGLLVMFFLIRTFHFHQHGPVGDPEPHDHEPHDHESDKPHDHHAHGDHDHGHDDHGHELSWIGLAIGLSVHTLLDGVALGAAVRAESQDQLTISFAIFLAIVLHKPLDALSITSLMAVKGWSTQKQLIVNACFALMCPLGVALFWVGLSTQGDAFQETVLGLALAFSAGVFLCISLGDLLPEVHFHRHDRVKLSIALLAGVAIAYAIELSHDHDSHSGHDHPPGFIHDDE